MTNVVKKKGKIEPFNSNKIKGALQKATIDAGYTVEEKKTSSTKCYSTSIKS
ncbi:ATP cone domain-containing protein [Methanobacterium petrolearium]|uniref:ATP cone domain-containing protein n=1 Tax=Methanobacterium petrolearium TaxID=710190 RepID=UPI003081EA07|nr:hypothetical protein GCM10025861_10660 [Methanobacterium petrolearium]